MADRARSTTRAPELDRLVAGLLGTALFSFRVLPGFLAFAIADLLVPFLVLFALRHERRVGPEGRGMFRNQRIVFRDRLTPQLSRRLLWRWARHVAFLFVDFCRMPRIRAGNLERFADVRDLEKLRPILAEGRGAICVTGHIGVWELCGHLASLRGIPVTAVARPLRNRLADARLEAVRTAGGQRVLSKWGVLWSLKKALDRGEVLGIVADENTPLEQKPCFAPFLGTLAATTTTPASLHRTTGVPIVVVACHRVRRERYRLRVWDVIRHEKTEDREADLAAITARMNDALSRAIREHPEQWLWGSRRFLTRPPGEALGPDGLPPTADLPATP